MRSLTELFEFLSNCGQNGSSDHLPPISVDHLILLTIN